MIDGRPTGTPTMIETAQHRHALVSTGRQEPHPDGTPTTEHHRCIARQPGTLPILFATLPLSADT
jgi:hypothetical protein